MLKRSGLFFLVIFALIFASCSGGSSSDVTKEKKIPYPSWLAKGIYVNVDKNEKSRIEFKEDCFILNDGITSLTVSGGELQCAEVGNAFTMSYKRSTTFATFTIQNIGKDTIMVIKNYTNGNSDPVTRTYGKHKKI